MSDELRIFRHMLKEETNMYMNMKHGISDDFLMILCSSLRSLTYFLAYFRSFEETYTSMYNLLMTSHVFERKKITI